MVPFFFIFIRGNMKTRIWRITVCVTDTPIDNETFKTIDEIKDFIDSRSEAGVDIKVTDYEDYGIKVDND